MNIDARLQQLEDALEDIHGQRLHGRLAQADWDIAKAAWRRKAKALIAEVVEEVKPEVRDIAARGTAGAFNSGFNSAIRRVETKAKELGL